MITGIVAMIAIFALGFFLFFRDLTGMELIGPNETASIEFDKGTYLIYDEAGFGTDVDIVGDSGPVELGGVIANSTITINDFAARATHSIDIETTGTYNVENNGTGRVGIGRPIFMRLLGLIFAPLAVGFVIVGVGLFMVIKGQRRRRRSGWSANPSNGGPQDPNSNPAYNPAPPSSGAGRDAAGTDFPTHPPDAKPQDNLSSRDND